MIFLSNNQAIGSPKSLASAAHLKTRGFTLIEIIAVLAVLAILAGSLVPALIKEADTAAQNIEATNLTVFATSFAQGCLRQRYIPDATYWAAFIATNANWQTNAVMTNSRNNQRVFLIDPAFTTSLATVGGSLPYSPYSGAEATGLSAKPVTPRFMIVSSMGSAPLPMASGIPASPDFVNLWATSDNAIPTGTSWSWSNFKQGSDIQIQRISMPTAFKHLVVYNVDYTGPTVCNIDIQPVGGGITPGKLVDGYFLSSTVVKLCFPTNSSNPIPLVELAPILNQDSFYTFQCGSWRASPPINVQGLAESFYEGTWRGGAHAAPSAVFGDMINYMSNYVGYGASGWSNNAALRNSQAQLATDIGTLIGP